MTTAAVDRHVSIRISPAGRLISMVDSITVMYPVPNQSQFPLLGLALFQIIIDDHTLNI